MAKIYIPINLDVARPNIYAQILAKQGDQNSRYISARIHLNSAPIDIPEAAQVKMNVIRSDGVGNSFEGYADCAGRVIVPVDKWITSVAGNSRCSIEISCDDEILTTLKFNINTEESDDVNDLGDPDLTPTDPEYDAVLDMLDDYKNGMLNGESCFVRYSASADGEGYTEVWSEGQKYLGIATGKTAPEDKSGYTWSRFVGEGGDGGASVEIVQELGNSDTAVMSQSAVTEGIASAVANESNKYFEESDQSINLFDKSQSYGEGILNFDGTVLESNVVGIYTIPVAVGKSYTFPINYGNFGWEGAYRVCCYNSANEYIGYLTAAHTDDNKYLTVTVTNSFSDAIAFVKVNVSRLDVSDVTYIETYMFVEGTSYPSEYIPYGKGDMLLKPEIVVSTHTISPLYKKSIVFAGDSLCAGTTDETGVLGWAQRIGEKYSMYWLNKAISGGTITSGVENSHGCIADTDFGAAPDYIILEGGVNDADLIATDESVTPEKYGSYNDYDFTSSFDKTTFCGAVEYLFKRVTTDYAGAKIGFIIAHKQGTSIENADYTAEKSARRFYYETIIKLCKKWGIPYIDLWEGCYLNPMNPSHNASEKNLMYYNGDYQHLAAAGYDYVTPMIESWIASL